MSRKNVTRRFFLMSGATALAGCAAGRRPSLARMGYRSPNEKLNLAAIGAGGQGGGDVRACASENFVALCDVDWDRASGSFERHPKAKRYKDFRVMLEREKSIDAVTVSTPDHVHAVAAMTAMKHGKHVYVQKPLTHSVYEARMLTQAARKYNVATQMGIQGHSGEGVRRLCEMIWSGVIGPVHEVHSWTDRPGSVWPQGVADRLPPAPVPEHLDWDLWLGPAPQREYNPGYAPRNWRGWWDFGTGALGDMGCHLLDPANWALQLGPPLSVECVMQEGKNDQTGPTKAIIRYEFPARNGMPPVTLYWYEGSIPPPLPAGVGKDVLLGGGANGSYFVGEKGCITTGPNGQDTRLVPDEQMKDYTFPEPIIPRASEHHKDWIQACKGGTPAGANFDYSGPFAETVLLAIPAFRCEGKLEWDAERMKFTNNKEANRYLRRTYRKGWTL